jgi:hypothetical protein
VATVSADEWYRRVRVESVPPGASLEIDGKPLAGVTPLTVQVPKPGESQLQLTMNGFERWTGRLVPPGIGEPLAVQLVPLISFRVESRPPGATVSCDGKRVLEATPGNFEITAGHHQLAVELPGYLPAKRQGTIDSSQRRWEVALKPGAFLDISSTPPGAKILIDGKEIGFDAPHRVLVAAGQPLQVEARSQSASSKVQRIPKLKPGKTVKVSLRVVDQTLVERTRQLARLDQLNAEKEKLERSLEAQRQQYFVKDAQVLVKLEQRIELLDNRIAELQEKLNEDPPAR